MQRDKGILRRIDKKFAELLDGIKRDRMRFGLDKRTVGDKRLTKAMLNLPEMKIIREELIKAKRKDE